jgi:hypothetical protein
MTSANTRPHTSADLKPNPCHPDWRKVSADLTDLIRTVSGKSTVSVVASPGAGHGAPGIHLFDHDVIELDADVCFPGLDPADIDVTDPYNHFRYPAGMGVALHEAAHCRHSIWLPPETWPGLVVKAANLLEEPRVESAQVQRRPADIPWLRASGTDIALDALAPTVTGTYPLLGVWQAAQTACLCLGRVAAGVFDAADPGVVAARAGLETALSAGLLAKLEGIWLEAITVADNDIEAMKALALRWCRLLISAEAKQAAVDPVALADAAASAAGAIGAIAAQVQVPDPYGGGWPAGTGGASGTGTGGASDPAASGKLFDAFTGPDVTRDPTADELAGAKRVTKAIIDAAQRPRAASTAASAVPPGRLSMRGAQAAAAQKASGAIVTAEPWRKKVKSLPPDPTVRVGIALDVSISMGTFLEPAGLAAWLLAKASAASGGSAAATTFGERARALMAPGSTPAKIPVPIKERATDHADTAIAALGQSLDLDRPDGNARLLFLITDGELAHSQTDLVAAICEHLADNGCAVMQIAPKRHTALAHAEVVVVDKPDEAIDIITTAVTAALRRCAQTP